MNRYHPTRRNLLRVVHSMDDIENGWELTDMLNESSYVAIKDGNVTEISDKCDMTRYRGFSLSEEFTPTFGLEKFGYNIVVGMKSTKLGYVLVGPASSQGFTVPIEDLYTLIDRNMYSSDSVEDVEYIEDQWFNDARGESKAGQKDYRDWFKFLAADILRNEIGKDTEILCQMYRVVLFIASRMQSRVLHPQHKFNNSQTAIRHLEASRRINSVVLELRRVIGECTDTDNMDREVVHTRNMRDIDKKILNLYAEGQICIKIAEKYYASDDKTLWKPMFDRLLKVLWTSHVFVQDNYIYKKTDEF
jgi:hypothetical protein